jgi:hypothetical protein
MKKNSFILVLSLLILTLSSKGQEIDQILEKKLNDEDAILVNIDQINDEAVQAEDFTADLQWLFNKPLALDLQGFDQLGEMELLTAYQINKLKEYVYRYGPMLSVYELRYVDGLTERDISIICQLHARAPETVLQGDSSHASHDPQTYSTPRKSAGFSFKPTRQSLTLRYGRRIETSPAYRQPGDTTNAHYAGSPDQMSVKYDLSLGRSLLFGFRTEKDAGEMTPTKRVPFGDQVIKPGFDHMSAHIQLSELGPVRKLIIGDYQVRLGQGLTLWNGYSMTRPFSATGVFRTAIPLKPNTGLAPFSFFRGAAAHLESGKFDFILFFSKRKLDATIEPLIGDSSGLVATTIRNTGYHRTLNELKFRKNLDEQVYGASASFSHRFFKISISGYRQRFGHPVDLTGESYTLFYFRGRENLVVGTEMVVALKKLTLFSEVASAPGKGTALLAGIGFMPVPHLEVSCVFHHKPKGYYNFLENHYGAAGHGIPGYGIYAGITLIPAAGVEVSGFYDYTSHSWMRFNARGLSSKHAAGLTINTEPSKRVIIRFGYRFSKGLENRKFDFGRLYKTGQSSSHSAETKLHFIISNSFEIRYLMEFKRVLNDVGERKMGTVVGQDLVFSPKSGTYSLFLRMLLFDTDDYDTRVYAYERDVYGAASIPAYYDRGSRMVVMGKVKLFQIMDIWLRYATFIYHDRLSIGSGLDEIMGNIKSEIRVQLRVKI